MSSPASAVFKLGTSLDPSAKDLAEGSSGAALLRKDEASASPKVDPPQQQGGILSQHFWANFLQVQIDKFCLLGLFVFLLKVCIWIGFSSDAGKIIFALANNILGAYVYSIQARRFKQ